jgi:single-stranded-DNA-specific exonuclease
VIVTDHHQPPERLPAAPAVDPHRADSTYPFPDLCGAAVAYKLCCATAALLGENARQTEADLLEFAVIGTVADVMPLVGENRFLVYHGLKRLARTEQTGLRALLDAAQLGRDGQLSTRDIGFGVGPRLNAAGRLENASMSYELLTTDDRARACQLADELERLNRERREIEARTTDAAVEQVQNQGLHEHVGLVVAGHGWHEGVLGLVAGRLCQRFHRPALALSITGDEAKGSGRSIAAFDLFAGLGECAELFTRFGGHPRAAGFSLPADRVDALRERFNQVARARLHDDDLTPSLDLECAVKGAAVNLALAQALSALAPFGEGHREPCLEITNLRLADARATRDGTHLQLSFETEDARGRQRLKGFWPRQGAQAQRLSPGAPVSVAGSIGVDTWNGEERAQILVEDMRVSGEA